MSTSYSVHAFIPDTDPEYQRHKKVLLACNEAEVSLPAETAKYFDTTTSEYLSILNEKLEIELVPNKHYTELEDTSEFGFSINLADLPVGVTKLKFLIG